MENQRTLARPYARAVFELAEQQGQLTYWSNVLQLLAALCRDVVVQQCYRDPRQSRRALIDSIYGIIEKAGNASHEVKNFLLLLDGYRRLLLLPAIAELFEEAKTQHEKMLPLTVTSAFPVSENLRARLQKALEKRLQRDVNMSYLVDPELLGGMVIRAGDLVIDGSVKSQLMKLKQAVISE